MSHMRLIAFIVFAGCAGLCSGCGIVCTHSMPCPNPIYSGIRFDYYYIVHKGYPTRPLWQPAVCAVDLPFSFTADTVLSPLDVYFWWLAHPSDPMKHWTFVPFPTDHSGHVTNTIDKAIVDDDYKFFIKNNVYLTSPVTGYFKDGKGHVSVKLEDNFSWEYALVYDSNNKRINEVRFDRPK